MSSTITVGIVVHLGSGPECPPIGARRVFRHIGYLGLVSQLYQMTKTDRNKYALKISGALRDNNEVQFIPINNDGDLWFFFAPEAGNRPVYLYVETKQSQSNDPVEISSSNDINNLVNKNHGPANTEVERCVLREYVNETWEASVRKLPKLMGTLQKCNPGTIVEWQHMPGGTGQIRMLKYLFWAFKPCIDGFQHCRSIICVDRTHLYAKYKQKLLIAISMDANKRILPLAYAIVDEENVDSWTWFIQMIAVHVARGRSKMCLICNTFPCILEAVKRVPLFRSPYGVYRFCLRQVCSDFNSKVENSVLKDLCWAAGSAGTPGEFENVMNQIKVMNREAYDYLQKIDRSRWTLAYDIGWRGGILTTNLSECMKGALKDTRRLSICAFVQATLYRSTKYFKQRLSVGLAMLQKNQPWTDAVCKKYAQMQREASLHHIYKADPIEQSATLKTFVPGSPVAQTHIVKLPQGECSCGQWRQTGVVCSHAAQTIRQFGQNPAAFIMPFCNTSSFVATYSGKFHPVPDECYWDEPSFKLCHNPAIRERPCKKRRRTTRNQHQTDGSVNHAGQQYCVPDQAVDRRETSRNIIRPRHECPDVAEAQAALM